ncbi:UDP-2,3-diacylglucosamine diphosphatase [Candidatus Pandoraea novymonadis]|uniref:UDP-2,3-diacylglucosamine diphosphatase n=1 Tax=Candidatus Pandoraea novymonadis TaxID=1808959 RepID=UPI001FE6E46F|nr:UDP-2,3-diacylglucosamine diphosphatase [Candidatus Pandoraea novymonadis]
MLIISDLHLNPSFPNTVRAFEDFLQGPSRQASALIILGDLFEYWVGDDMLNADCPAQSKISTMMSVNEPFGIFARRITKKLAELAGAGVPIAVMPGNRDFLLGQYFAHMASVTMLSDPCIATFQNTRLVLSHGDALCLDDTRYLRYRRIARSSLCQAFFLAMPLQWRIAIAERFRKHGTTKRAHSTICADVDSGETRALLSAADAKILVHGHTHRPACHIHGEQIRWVLPDWEFDVDLPRGGYLQWDECGLRAISLSLPD